MFDVNGFIMKTLNGMVGKYPDFQVREYALNWYEKGKLTEDDLATIDTMIEEQKVKVEALEEIVEEEPEVIELADESIHPEEDVIDFPEDEESTE